MSEEIAVRRVDDLGLEPLAAFARLRSYTPGRAAFLIESLAPKGGEARYSIAGYRVLRCGMMPPGIDAIAVQAEELEAIAAPEAFAAAVALGGAGFFSSSIANLWQRIKLHDDEGPTGIFTAGATVVVFDHREGTITVAGRAKGNLVDRCIWEMKNGPDPAPLPAGDALPDALSSNVADEKLQARAVRAKPFAGEIDSLMLARTFSTPIGDADAFDCYRALRALGRPHGYYLDFGENPMQPRLQLLGVGEVNVHLRHHGEPGAGVKDSLRGALPHPRTTGGPASEVLRLLRQLEDGSRQSWGGAVGYLTAGGAGSFVLADEIVVAEQGHFSCTAGFTIDEAADPMTAPEATHAAATPRLRAIATAQRAKKPEAAPRR